MKQDLKRKEGAATEDDKGLVKFPGFLINICFLSGCLKEANEK